MATSGTYDFNPSFGDLILMAYSRCGVRRTAVLQEHMDDARMEANLLLVEFANRGPNLWTVDLITTPLTQGVGTYAVDASTVMILDAYISTTTNNVTTDRIITPISRTEYASYPIKDQQGYPTVFWFNRQISPTVTLWQVPDGEQVYTLKYYRYSQVEDAVAASGLKMDLPNRFLDAFMAGLAARLAVIWAPDRAVALRAEADRTWNIAATQDTENVPMYVQPYMGGYFR